MPTNRRRIRPQRRADPRALTSEQRSELAGGWPAGLGGHGFDTVAEFKAKWEIHLKEMVAEFIEHRPGHRPFGAWMFDIVPKYGERPVIGTELTRDMFVQSKQSRECRWGVLHTNLTPFLQEPEPIFLHRLGLLAPGEWERAQPQLRTEQADNAAWLALKVKCQAQYPARSTPNAADA